MNTSQTPLWTSEQAASATDGNSNHAWNASGVSINTRTLAKGDLFVALNGPSLDGHDFVSDAFDRGAVAATVSKNLKGITADRALLMVEDTQKALEDLGRAARNRASQATFIAVTGSVGKTGIKEALASVLSNQGGASASEGSLNNHWGLPLSLSRVPQKADFAILEMGMNHAGELTPLSHMARPHVCVITTVQPAHTENFASLDEIADAKAEIFVGAEPGAVAVLHHDIAQFDRLSKAATKKGMRVLSFGCDEAADVHLVSYDLDASGSSVSVLIEGARFDYRVGIAGRHWVMNSLCVLAAVMAAGGDVARAAADLAHLQAPQGRGQRFEIAYEKGNFKLIDESYNASPASMKAALQVLSAEPALNGGRRIAVLGDMLELGADTVPSHRALAAELKSAHVDLAFLTGEAMASLWVELPEAMQGGHMPTSDLIALALQGIIHEGDVVMVKGSAGAQMGRVVETLKQMGRVPAGER